MPPSSCSPEFSSSLKIRGLEKGFLPKYLLIKKAMEQQHNEHADDFTDTILWCSMDLLWTNIKMDLNMLY